MRGESICVAVDFDGTISEHKYPGMGPAVPGAIEWMMKWQAAGANLILWTMRSGPELSDAVNFCRVRGIEFYGVNHNPTQDSWTTSPKVYASVYVDDNAACCPLVIAKSPFIRPYVDWSIVGPMVMERIERSKK